MSRKLRVLLKVVMKLLGNCYGRSISGMRSRLANHGIVIYTRPAASHPIHSLVDASGQPKLLDFGIAKLLDETKDPTRTIDRLLTPSYASPEQLRGTKETTVSDVYSLAAVLYKILTGRSPHESESGTVQAIDVIQGTKDIPAPSQLNPKLPNDVDYILRRALRSEPEDRYASVEAFTNDSRALLESRPVQARSDHAWYRTRSFCGVTGYRLAQLYL
jgi:serine/threonine protein kinase